MASFFASAKLPDKAQPLVRLPQYPPTRVTVDRKLPDPGPPDEEGEPVDLVDNHALGVEKMLSSSVFMPGKVYKFRLSRTAAVTTSGSGLLALATGVYPAQFTQYSYLAGLFKESRLVAVKIKWVMQGTSTVVPFAYAFDPTWTSGTPTFDGICSIPGAKLTNSDRPFVPQRESSWSARAPRPFSLISATSGTDPSGGNIGAWLYSISTATTASTTIGTYLIEAEFEFRSIQS